MEPDNLPTSTRLGTTVIGTEMLVKDMVHIIIPMVTSMKAIGTEICKMEQGLTTTPTGISTKDSGSTAVLMAKETTFTPRSAESTKATGGRDARRDSDSL